MMRRAYNSPPRAKSKKIVNFPDPSCGLCGGTGWRLVMIDTSGNRRVTRCDCRIFRRRPLTSFLAPDYKSAAAGERE